MDPKNYLDDISEIKTLMNRSSRFLSLSGLSGILAGVYALIGAFLANQKLTAIRNIGWNELSDEASLSMETNLVIELFVIAGGVLFLAVLTGIILSFKKAKRSGEKIWNPISRRLLVNFLIPLVTGGLFCMALMQYGFAGLVAPATLIFYGLACVNASKYTLGDVRYSDRVDQYAVCWLWPLFLGLGFWCFPYNIRDHDVF